VKRLIVVRPHGFCSGVARAIETARKVLAGHPGETVYCLHEIVHNGIVVEDLAKRGMAFVEHVEEVPQGALLLFSAHGVAPEVRRAAEARRLRVVDATCPFVARVHAAVRGFAAAGTRVVCIGHREHVEVIGVAGEAPGTVSVVENEAEAEALALPPDVPVAVVTQTTLGAAQVDRVLAILRRRFPPLQIPEGTDVCYATRNRQRAVTLLAKACDRVLVLGSANSSNTQRLVETAREAGAEAVLVNDRAALERLAWPEDIRIGVTSGASTPETFLNEVVASLRMRHGFPEPETMAVADKAG
jgi:4-hydroxy-3-methylbut-2-enyl diphosphate reductase